MLDAIYHNKKLRQPPYNHLEGQDPQPRRPVSETHFKGRCHSVIRLLELGSASSPVQPCMCLVERSVNQNENFCWSSPPAKPTRYIFARHLFSLIRIFVMRRRLTKLEKVLFVLSLFDMAHLLYCY